MVVRSAHWVLAFNIDESGVLELVQEMLEYSARCLTSYAAEMQADWRGSGHQVPLEVFREFQICLGRSALNVEDWHWNLEQLSAWWIMFLLRSEPSLNGSSQLAG
ncbi:unnamed protein product [Effrenium voratum]|uniref:Uncharacterized protein n=1 Tax=Effrenium voratum TaxID=2562239 RepID=A0AA36HJ61_9DINO|nr:unnamed protein product [Effrenium voratum]